MSVDRPSLEAVVSLLDWKKVDATLAGNTSCLAEIARRGGLDPTMHFRGAVFAGTNLSGIDIRGINFTGADLRGTRLREAILDSTTTLRNALLDEEDAVFVNSKGIPTKSNLLRIDWEQLIVPREKEIAEIESSLTSGSNVLLLGHRGTGKTTLGRRVVANLASKNWLTVDFHAKSGVPIDVLLQELVSTIGLKLRSPLFKKRAEWRIPGKRAKSWEKMRDFFAQVNKNIATLIVVDDFDFFLPPPKRPRPYGLSAFTYFAREFPNIRWLIIGSMPLDVQLRYSKLVQRRISSLKTVALRSFDVTHSRAYLDHFSRNIGLPRFTLSNDACDVLLRNLGGLRPDVLAEAASFINPTGRSVDSGLRQATVTDVEHGIRRWTEAGHSYPEIVVSGLFEFECNVLEFTFKYLSKNRGGVKVAELAKRLYSEFGITKDRFGELLEMLTASEYIYNVRGRLKFRFEPYYQMLRPILGGRKGTFVATRDG